MFATSLNAAANTREEKHYLFQNVFRLASWLSHIPKGQSLKASMDPSSCFAPQVLQTHSSGGKKKQKRTRAPVIIPYNYFLKYTAYFRNIQPIFPQGCDLTILPYNKRLKPRKQQFVKSKLGNIANLKFYPRVRIESIQQHPAFDLLFLARKVCDLVQHHLLF